MEYALLLGLFAILGGALWLLARSAKANGIAEATLDGTKEDLEAVAKIMKDAKDNETMRDKVYRNSLAGKRPASVRKYDR